MKGTVVLSVVHEDLSLNGSIHISLVGKEQTWTTPTLLTTCRGHETEEIIFEEEHVVHEFHKEQASCQRTQSFPFSIFLPGSLAPSMYLEDDHQRGCAVSYELTAWYGSEVVSVSRQVQIVGPTLSTKTYPYHLSPTRVGRNFLLAAKLENTHVAKGGKMEVSLAFRNRSFSVELKQLNVELVEEIQWKTPTQRHSYTHVLSELHNVPLPSIHAAYDDEAGLEMEEDLCCAQKSQIEVHIPGTARDSYHGTKLVQVKHALCVRMMSTDHNTEYMMIPVAVCDPPILHRRTPSKESRNNGMMTVWPGDVSPPLSHEPSDLSSEHSCPRIVEELE